MQDSFGKFFKKDSTLMWSALAGTLLWITNAVFNIIDNDYRAFCINLLYAVCLLALLAAGLGKENDVIQGMIGALLMVSVIGNVNVMSEMQGTAIPSRALWQMAVGAVLTVGLFINHFMITMEKKRVLWRIRINQIIVIALILFRCCQVIMNVVSRGFTPLMIEVTVGMLAIIPTLNVVVCIESRTDAYVPNNDRQ